MADRRNANTENRNRQKRGTHFVRLGDDLLESDAWFYLSGRAFKL
jgi:hypothetical protein